MFESRAAKIAKITREIQQVQEALQKGTTYQLQYAISCLEGALEGVPIEGKGEEVVHAGLNTLAAARPELAKGRAVENQKLDAGRQARLRQIAQPCARCGGCEIFVGEGADIVATQTGTENVSDDRLVCNVLVCASCGDVRMVANLADVAARRFFVRTTAVGAAPYR